ncbi:conserved hypothetical protein [Ricinus communis]|uniref:Ubiquitin-like protease family profile domain-containing protein n=1 Tax=Ricinus communis TaxID=3988 RepID=B9SIW6_RICCO|nr:conserved hypothetical protein [Ricinus communis]
MEKKDPKIGERVRNFSRHFLKFPWQSTKNQVDCGMYYLRHMETFKGDLPNWNAKLTI